MSNMILFQIMLIKQYHTYDSKYLGIPSNEDLLRALMVFSVAMLIRVEYHKRCSVFIIPMLDK